MESANFNLVTSRARSVAVFDWAKRIAQRFAAVLVWLLGPVSLLAYAFAAWRVAADIGWSASFFIPTGLFSHWLIWLSIGLALSFSASMLNEDRMPAGSGNEAEPE